MADDQKVAEAPALQDISTSSHDRLLNMVYAVNKMAGMKNPIANVLVNRLGGLPVRLMRQEFALFVRWAFQFLSVINMAAKKDMMPSEFEAWLDKSFEEAKSDARSKRSASA